MSIKKILSVLLCIALTASMAGCGSDPIPETDPSSEINTSENDNDIVPVPDDEPQKEGAMLEGSAWEFGSEYIGFGSEGKVSFRNTETNQTRTGFYTWDGTYGQIIYNDNGETLFLEAFSEDPMIEKFLYITDMESTTAEYVRCAEFPGGEIVENPAPNSSSESGSQSENNNQYEIPESLRPTFSGSLSLEESKIGTNLDGRVGNLGGTSWGTGDDIYTFFDDGFVLAFNTLVGGDAVGTYNVSQDGNVTCLMDNGAEMQMKYKDGKLFIIHKGETKEMMSFMYDPQLYTPHEFNGADSMVGSAWKDSEFNIEYCFLADDIFVLYDPENQETKLGSYAWNEDASGTIFVGDLKLGMYFDKAHLYVEGPNGYQAHKAVHQEQLSSEFLGMERVLCGTWQYTEEPKFMIQILLTGAGYSYNNEHGQGQIYADSMQYDGRTLTLLWPENDGELPEKMIGHLSGDGCLYFDGMDGHFVRIG